MAFTFNGVSAGSAPVVNGTAWVGIVLTSTVIPNGAGSYTASATFTADASSNYGSGSATTSVVVRAEGRQANADLDGSSRLDYAGDQFAVSATAPTLSVVLRQGLGPETGDGQLVDFSKVNVQVTFQLFPATCTTRKSGTTCASAAFTSAVAVGNATDWATTGNGVASVAAPSTLANGAYVLVATISSGTAFIAPERATSTLEVSPTGITAISGGGFVNPDSTSNAANNVGYFGFDTEKLSKSSIVGSMAYVYRVRIDTGASTRTSFVTCASLGGACRDVDVIIRSTGVTALNGGQKGFATGTVAVNFVDAVSGTDYTALDYAGGTFRIDIVDNSQQNLPSQFGFTAYLADGTTPFHQAFIPVGGGIAQTGIGVLTNETTIASGFITSHP